jgi:hypothetical protein
LTFQIDQVLAHPYLATPVPDPIPFHMPYFTTAPAPTHGVVLDVAFLGMIMGRFHLCESLDVVRGWIAWGSEPWAIQWAAMLSMWKQREETLWEDVAMPKCEWVLDLADAAPVLSRSDNVRAARKSLRPLREIQLSPKMDSPKVKHKFEAPKTPALKTKMVSPPRQMRQRYLSSVQAELNAAQAAAEESPLVSKRAGQAKVKAPAPRVTAGTKRAKREGEIKVGRAGVELNQVEASNPFVQEEPVSPLVAGYLKAEGKKAM